MGRGVRVALFFAGVVAAAGFVAVGVSAGESLPKGPVPLYVLAAGCLAGAIACFFPRLWGTPDSQREPLPGGEDARRDRAARSQRVLLWASGGAAAGVLCGIATRALVDQIGWPAPWHNKWEPLFGGLILGKALGAALGYHLAWRRDAGPPGP